MLNKISASPLNHVFEIDFGNQSSLIAAVSIDNIWVFRMQYVISPIIGIQPKTLENIGIIFWAV